MSEQRFPRPDADFAAHMAVQVEAIKAWWNDQGLNPDELTPLNEAYARWISDYPALLAAKAAARAARENKDIARDALIAAARAIIRFIQSFPATTNAQRAAIGITIKDSAGTPVPPPTSRPLVVVTDAGRRTHRLRLLDEGHSQGPLSRATRRARPRGVDRAEVFVAFTQHAAPAPKDPRAYRYVQSISDGSMVMSFDTPEAGLQAHYLARWVTRRNAPGPWSETASATIAA